MIIDLRKDQHVSQNGFETVGLIDIKFGWD